MDVANLFIELFYYIIITCIIKEMFEEIFSYNLTFPLNLT